MARLLLALAAVALLSSCAHMAPGRSGEPTPVDVYANADGYLVVNQEPIYVKAKDARITWRLPAVGGLTFAPGAERIIVTESPPGEFKCEVADAGKTLVCIDRNSKPGRYKYMLTVQQDGKRLEPLDPSIVNH